MGWDGGETQTELRKDTETYIVGRELIREKSGILGACHTGRHTNRATEMWSKGRPRWVDSEMG